MKNYIAIHALEKVFSAMISGVLPVCDNHDDLMNYLKDSAAEQVRRILEEDGDYTLERAVDACEELALFFGHYSK